jgi:hypothetical protein
MILRILLTLYIKIKIFIKTTTRECKKYIYTCMGYTKQYKKGV